ncbi:unnamed protein product [Adineta steineri]|uniref:PDZ domain-containing protein n=1 Tax=Adineta steineri TaxID=433720 RepID=A0A814PDQ8_9BILA|nr:unnamed protein product [Adineta steineri]
MFKSGHWKSQYFQYGKWHGPCRFSLTFDTNSMTVKGTGSDDIGKFTINGIYSHETSRLGLSKKYQLGTGNKTENLGHTVTIQLTWNETNNQFEGKWYVQTNKYHGNDKFQLKFDGQHLSTNLNSDDKSLGFTIGGGIDKPVLNHFTSIIISHIYENALADGVEQLKSYDILLRVNDIDITNMKQETVVDILKRSGKQIKLFIRRLSPPIIKTIELQHNGRLGIRITGGIGREYIPDDHGIFIKHINTLQTNDRLEIGDRLLQISSMHNSSQEKYTSVTSDKQEMNESNILHKLKLALFK